MSSKNFQIIIAFILCLNLVESTNIISIPFEFKFLKYNSYYNSTNFIYDYFIREIILKLNIGTPPQKVKAKLDKDSSCFIFKKETSNENDYSNYKSYYPNLSTSLKINNESSNSFVFEDLFHFEKMNESVKLSFSLNNQTMIVNDSYTPVIGLNFEPLFRGNLCPNLIFDLKKMKITDKLVWSVIYNNKYDGIFVIGDELSEYNSVKYDKMNYSTLYLNKNHQIEFESIYIQDWYYKSDYDSLNSSSSDNIKNKIKEKLNYTKTYLNINSGLIIGTDEYKEYIDKNFFNYLFNKSICKSDIINYTNDNISFNEYYVYSCYGKWFTGQRSQRYQSTNYYKDFPKLIFSSKRIEYNFVLTNEQLFEYTLDRYYFSIIFSKNNKNDVWQLGEPFYKKFTFTMNPDSKTIGFYVGKGKSKELNETINSDSLNENNNVLKYIFIIGGIILGLALLFMAYYIGTIVREKRKKRANELKDDDYEYLPEENNKIN